MKLRTQLNVSFILLLVIVLSITAVLFYTFSFQILKREQLLELQARGAAWIQTAEKGDQTLYKRELNRLKHIPIRTGNVEVILYNQGQHSLIYSSLDSPQTKQVVSKMNHNMAKRTQGIWSVAGQKYIVEKWKLKTKNQRQLSLVMASPLRGVRALQMKFSFLLLVVLLIGGLVAFIISHFITKRLTGPLSQVNEQLKKVKKREFDQIYEIKTNGEIGEVAVNTYQMAMELQRFIQSQKHFFQNASHELKTPLMAIQGFAEGVADGVFQEERATHAICMIIDESERLKRLVNEMILLAKLESYEESYETEMVDLESTLEDAINRVLALAENRSIFIEFKSCGDHLRIIANRERLLQAFINLLENGIRYAASCVNVYVQLNQESAEIRIEDDGPGISEEVLSHLFYRFVKGKDGQNGLGLAITRAIIEKAYGTVQAENRSEGGSRFTLQLPLDN